MPSCRCDGPGSADAPNVLSWTAGDAYLPLLQGPPTTRGMRSGRVDLGPGDQIGRHDTGDHEEVLVVIEGCGVAELAGRDPVRIQAGQVLYVPPHTAHNIHNLSCPRLRYVYVVAPVPADGAPPAAHGP